MHETTLRLSSFQLKLIEALLLWLTQHEYFITRTLETRAAGIRSTGREFWDGQGTETFYFIH